MLVETRSFIFLNMVWSSKLPMVLLLFSELKRIYTTLLKMPLASNMAQHFSKKNLFKKFKEWILITICICISIKHHWGLKTYSTVGLCE